MPEEMIDILNSDGTPAGYSRSRTEVHAKGLWHRTVHIWTFDKNGRIVFQQRSHLKENNPNLLDTSCAGHITAGDNSRNAAIRELRHSKSPRYMSFRNLLFTGDYFAFDYCYKQIPYKITLSDEEVEHLVPQPGEVDDFILMTRDEFLTMFAQNPEKFVNHPKDYAWIKSLQIMQK